MIVPIPHRRPFLEKLRTSVLKRRLRVRRRIAQWLGAEENAFISRYFGADFRVFPGELVSDEIAINRLEWRELKMMITACRELRPAVFIDVGANIGLYSCIVGKAGVVPRVVAFEPDARTFARLTQNIDRNGLAAIVEPRPCAVGSKRGTAFLTPGPPENIGLSKVEDTGAIEQSVDVIALDDELDFVDSTIAVKIDVEGYELEVLAGAARLFGRNAGYAQVEGLGDERATEITELMTGYGWQFVERYGLDLRFERPLPRTALKLEASPGSASRPGV